jgi:hypothetical protein
VKEFIEKMEEQKGAAFILFKPEEPGSERLYLFVQAYMYVCALVVVISLMPIHTHTRTHKYIHTYIHTYIPTYIHTYIQERGIRS